MSQIKSNHQLTFQSEEWVNYFNVLLYLLSLDDVYVHIGIMTSLCSFLKFILSEDEDYSMVLSPQFMSRLIFQVQKMFAPLQKLKIPMKNVYNVTLNVLALINLMFSKRHFDVDDYMPKCNLLLHSNYLRALLDEDVLWNFLICFVFPSCSQSTNANASTLTLPFFISQEIVNSFLNLPESFCLSSIISLNILNIVSRLSEKNRKKLVYLIKRSKCSKFRISGFKAIDFDPIDLDEPSFVVPENIPPPQFLSLLQQLIISTIDESTDRYMFSLLRIFCALPTNSYIDPTENDALDIILSEDSLYFSSIFLIFLMNRKDMPPSKCLNILLKGISKCTSFAAIYSIVQYYFTSFCASLPFGFTEYLLKSPAMPRLDLAKYFYGVDDFIKASYFFELAQRCDMDAECTSSFKYLKRIYGALSIIDDATWFSSQDTSSITPFLSSPSSDSDIFPFHEANLRNLEQRNILAYETASRQLRRDSYFSAFCFLDSYSHQTKSVFVPPFIRDIYAAAAWKLQKWDIPLNGEINSCSTQFVPSLLNSFISKHSYTRSILESFSQSLVDELEKGPVLHSIRFNNLNFFNLLFTLALDGEFPFLLKTYDHISSPLLVSENSEKLLFFHYLSSMVFDSSTTLTQYAINSLKVTRKLKMHNLFKNIFERVNTNGRYEVPTRPKVIRILYHQCKYLWDNDSIDIAVSSLQKLILPLESISENDEFERDQQSKLRRKLSEWKLSTQSYNLNDLLPIFNEAIQLSPKNEKSYYAMANFQLRLFANFKYSQDDCSREEHEWISSAMKNFARVVIIGGRLADESFPKLLSFWLNMKNETLFASIHKIVTRLFERIVPTQFANQFTHLISRICHERHCVSDLISKCILLLFKSHPHTVLWGLLSASRSSHPPRASRAMAILQLAKGFSGMTPLVELGVNFTEALIHLCDAQITSSSASLQKDFKFLKKLFPINIQLPHAWLSKVQV